MSLEDIPEELHILNSLEQYLIALHIAFMKVVALPEGKQKTYMDLLYVSHQT
jgi:hypothetical protein